MRTIAVALALGLVLALCTADQTAKAEVRKLQNDRIRAPRATDPYWVPDYYIVPRYRYRPQDDRVEAIVDGIKDTVGRFQRIVRLLIVGQSIGIARRRLRRACRQAESDQRQKR